MSPAVHLPIDPAAIVLLPVDEEHSFFDWHFPASGYIGGLVDNPTRRRRSRRRRGEGNSPLLASAAGTLLFMLTAETPDDSVTMAEAFDAFAEDAQPTDAEYVAAGPSAMSLLAFDGVDRQYPWIAVVASPPNDAEQAIDDAETLTRLIAGTAVPPAPAPTPDATSTITANTATPATTTTVPVATSGPAAVVAAPCDDSVPERQPRPTHRQRWRRRRCPGRRWTTAAASGRRTVRVARRPRRPLERAGGGVGSGSAIAGRPPTTWCSVVDEPQDSVSSPRSGQRVGR